MYARRTLFGDSRRQVILVILFAMVLFIALMGRQGIARDVALGDGYAYVAVGRFGGVRILDVQDPLSPLEVGYYDTPGLAQRVTLAGNHVLVADGRWGMRIIEVSDPRRPVVVGILQNVGDVQDIAVAGNYAYLANGDQGFAIVDIANPTRPFVVSQINTPGFARRVALTGVVNPVTGTVPGAVEGSDLQVTYAYLADGTGGLQVIDVHLPVAPEIVGNYDPGEVRDVVAVGSFALVASGRNGLRLVNITNPLEPVEYSAFPQARDATALTLQNATAYIAAGEAGVWVVDLSNPLEPHALIQFDTRGTAHSVAVDRQYVYVADGEWGVRIVDLERPFDVGRMGAYETPGEASFLQVLRAFFAALTGRWGDIQLKVWRTLLVTLFDIILFLIVIAFWLFFFAQFVLPVKSLNERWQAARRLLAYHTGRHGPAIFIQNGEIRQRAHEKNLRGPGVALLDTASAAVMRSAYAFTRAVGPGIVFTGPNEYPEGAVDLHRQFLSIGLPEGEDPYRPRLDDEPPESYEARQRIRYQTSGLTRDGVEVVPIISISFCLMVEPGMGHTRFGYNPASVWKAIAREGINPDEPADSQLRLINWNELPGFLAADLWREYLRKFTLDQLFSYTPMNNGKNGAARRTAFDTIIKMMRERMTEPEVADMNETGEFEGPQKPSKEYEMLKERGLKILEVSVRSLRFPPSLEEQLVEQWKASWLQRAQAERRDVERIHSLEPIAGQDQAIKHFGSVVGQNLSGGVDRSPDLPETLELLLQGTLKLAVREPELHQRMTNQKTGLIEIIEWIRKQ